VGGIESAEDIFEYIANGASLVQLYTGFVNHGPRLPAKILTEMLDKLGERNISEIVGMWS
jgi:dihydroorotate dehydrogenase